MKKKIIIIFSWLLVLMWMGLIYYFSNMNGTESTGKDESFVSWLEENEAVYVR